MKTSIIIPCYNEEKTIEKIVDKILDLKNTDLEIQISKIKSYIKKNFKIKNPKILYGGSVNPKNIRSFSKIKLLGGFLIGGASQNPKKFIDIIKKSIN